MSLFDRIFGWLLPVLRFIIFIRRHAIILKVMLQNAGRGEPLALALRLLNQALLKITEYGIKRIQKETVFLRYPRAHRGKARPEGAPIRRSETCRLPSAL